MPPQNSSSTSSFIPKANLANTDVAAGSFGIVTFLTVLIFILSVIGAGGVFAYQQVLKNGIASKAHTLQLNQDAFGSNTIEDLARMDTRIAQAKTLLNKHVAASAVFAFLGSQTLQTVQFTSFDYKLSNDRSGSLSMEGVATSFSAVALQSDQFGGSKVLKDVIFSDINPDQAGKVRFTVKATIAPDLLLYSHTVQGASAAAPATSGAPVTNTVTTQPNIQTAPAAAASYAPASAPTGNQGSTSVPPPPVIPTAKP
jgi:hypothetical protein